MNQLQPFCPETLTYRRDQHLLATGRYGWSDRCLQNIRHTTGGHHRSPATNISYPGLVNSTLSRIFDTENKTVYRICQIIACSSSTWTAP